MLIKGVFFLTVFHTNSIIVLVFDETNRQYAASLYLTIALAKNKKNHIFFLGGEQADDPYSALVRK